MARQGGGAITSKHVAQAERWREGRVTKGINDIGQDPLHCGVGGMVGKGGTIDGGLTWGKVKTKEGRAAVWGGGRRRGAIWGGGEGRGCGGWVAMRARRASLTTAGGARMWISSA